MFDPRKYRPRPEDSLRSEQEAMAKADMPETPEELRKRARNLGNKKTRNASGRKWWDQR